MTTYVSNGKNLRYLESLKTDVEKLRYMTGGRVTVARVTQLEDGELVHHYAAKIRGIVVGNDNEWKHDTPESARQFGKEVMSKWRKELSELSSQSL